MPNRALKCTSCTRTCRRRGLYWNSPLQLKASEIAGQAAPESNAAAVVEPSTPLEQRVQKLEESSSLIGSKIDEQYQTKVETASKYRARLHGIVLMNAFRNVGNTDNVDFPNYSLPVRNFFSQADNRSNATAVRNWPGDLRPQCRRRENIGRCSI